MPRFVIACWPLLIALPTTLQPAAFGDAPVDFNRDIRPILAGSCFKCHGPDPEEREGGLRLDVQAGSLAESDSGFAIVPGKPEASMLLDRIAAADPGVQMPPADSGAALTDAQVALLRRWIEAGAPWSRHWSYEPPVRRRPPATSHGDQLRNSIDSFVLARLERHSLAPSSEASRYELLRRLSLDLTGLPPTIAEADAFLADQRPDAYERVVDRLLASPRFGERFSRAWLDIARYADSAGYAQDPPRTIWRYRDWVIDAFNAGMPFDQFSIEQLAGDMLPHPTDRQLLATAFHRNTMTNSEGGTDDEEFRSAAVVDRVNTTMQAWMGLTMECAQCHNHKYDPILQEEYYKFYAVFNNTEDADRGDERPRLETLTPAQQQQQRRLHEEIGRLEQELARRQASPPKVAPPAGSGPLKTRFVRIELPGKGAFLHLAEVQVFVGEENVAAAGKASQISTGYNGPARLAIDGDTGGDYFGDKSTSHTGPGDDPWWEVDLGKPFAVERVKIWNRTDGGAHARLHHFRVVALDGQRQPVWVKSVESPPNPTIELALPKTTGALNAADRQTLAAYTAGAATPPDLPERRQIEALRKKLAAIKGVPTPIMRELPPPRRRKTHIHLRGNFRNRGDEVTSGVPAAFHALPEQASPDRLGVARWLVDKQNPLTARVLVNRYWEQLFGVGIVATSEDFGSQGELPSHPELLDHLAVELMRRDWDPKWLIREIVNSATYRQTSRVSPAARQVDPDNRLLANGPRFRLSAEMIRDQALAVAGLLSTKMHGPSVLPPRPNLGLRAAFGGSTDWKPSPGEDKYRRGLYTSWRRTTPYPSFMTFDATSREVCTIRRVRTNTPLQALVTLNDPVFVEAAQAWARRVVREGGSTPAEQAEYGFRLILCRPPSGQERAQILKLLEKAMAVYSQDQQAAAAMAAKPLGPVPRDLEAATLAAWTVVGNVLLNLDETLARK